MSTWTASTNQDCFTFFIFDLSVWSVCLCVHTAQSIIPHDTVCTFWRFIDQAVARTCTFALPIDSENVVGSHASPIDK